METSGVLIINKPRGLTSHDVVDKIRRITEIRAVGHAGTLDPLARGILIILIGKATKKQAEFMAGEKEYIATVLLGATSNTNDAEGTITKTPKSKFQIPNKIQLLKCLNGCKEEIWQIPPAYSAIKVHGQKAYEAARKGTPLKLPPRKITIKEIKLISYEWPELKLRVSCSSGTYIRALARDIGQKLGCGAYLETLTRAKSGGFKLKDAVKIEILTKQNWRQYLAK